MENLKSKFNEFIKDVLTLANEKYKLEPDQMINELKIIINIMQEVQTIFENKI